jgi:hypothetical protein
MEIQVRTRSRLKFIDAVSATLLKTICRRKYFSLVAITRESKYLVADERMTK